MHVSLGTSGALVFHFRQKVRNNLLNSSIKNGPKANCYYCTAHSKDTILVAQIKTSSLNETALLHKFAKFYTELIVQVW